TEALTCGNCGATTPIPAREEPVEELDYASHLAGLADQEERFDVVSVACGSCGAISTLPPNAVSGACPFCGSPLVVKEGSTRSLLKPRSLLPFSIDGKAARQALDRWLGSLWFAPFGFKKAHKETDRLTGVYIPYWTFDAHTETDYTGERGDAYYTTETYTTEENGRTVTRTRQVRHIRWFPAAGRVAMDFDDLLVLASRSLPEHYTAALEPWDLAALAPFDEAFLAGFRAEAYQVTLEAGFAKARAAMEGPIAEAIRRDIGGDEQRIQAVDTQCSRTTFKHLLLPVWISAFRYGEKVFRCMINGRTGEVQGERPYSWAKILLLAAAVLALVIFWVSRS
ncbi:MAG TPA: hypothetical protein VN436_04985, partial [Holophaga sp.]|nr:hypothetical protein [Holophaga sp.]